MKYIHYLNWSGRLGLSLMLLVSPVCPAYTLDRIVAVVEDGVILETELQSKVDAIKKSLRSNQTPLPPEEVLQRQVLERLIADKIQLQLADKMGIRVDDETLRQAVQQIAQRHNMSMEEFRDSLRQEGLDYSGFVDQIRTEIATGRLRNSQVNSQIKLSDKEVEHFLATQGQSSLERDSQYHLGHILIATRQAASPQDVQQARDKAEKLAEQIKAGLDFKQASIRASDSPQALNGGDLGWRKLAEIPSLFAEIVPGMREGEIAGPIRSPSGFHIIKILGMKGSQVASITKTHVRHILLKPNEVLSDEEAKRKLLSIRHRLENGEDFAQLARGHSDDKGSAIKGGDLGWVQTGALVPPFEEAMNRLGIRELSEPVQTQFGWHLIQVMERQESSDTAELLKNQARDELFKRKVEEETELWLRRIRDEAYVDIRLQ
ncbi:MAG: peptidylprolyl isomerase [Methylococcaceae bacterium]